MTILIAEDDALLRTFLGEVLSRHPNLIVVGTAADGRSCLEAVERFRPELLLLDINLPGMDGLKVLRELGEREEGPQVLVLSGADDEETQVEAARSGARGFLPKSEAARVLPRALEAVAGGQLWFSRAVSDHIFREHHRLMRQLREQERPINRLSEREREVLLGVARGLTNNQIAADLYMSIHTVKLHVQNILRKLNLPNRTEAAVFAVREGLLEPAPANGREAARPA